MPVMAIWGGQVSSQPLVLERGHYTVAMALRGTEARDTMPAIELLINGTAVAQFACKKDYTPHIAGFFLPTDTIVIVTFRLQNDLYDPVTEADRNAFIKDLFIRAKD